MVPILGPCPIPLHVDFGVRLVFTDQSGWATETAPLRELLARLSPCPNRCAVSPTNVSSEEVAPSTPGNPAHLAVSGRAAGM